MSIDPPESEPDQLGGTFRFRAGMLTEYDCVYDVETDVDAMKLVAFYRVDLPHQCDAWEVVHTEDRTEAIERMETFIAEAREALQRLRALPETADGRPDGASKTWAARDSNPEPMD